MRIRNIIETERGIARTDVLAILSSVLSLSREEILRDSDKEISSQDLLLTRRFINERLQGRPVAYITKRKEFYSHLFFVDERVLIPRPETEFLVEEALKILENKPTMDRILDMGTGSGAIGVTVAMKTQAQMVFVDVSPDALFVARVNALSHGVAARSSFLCSDLFGGIRPERHFGIVLANLPYVPAEQWASLMRDVRAYEPRLALDGGAGGTEVYERMLQELPRYLQKDGRVLCEIDGDRQAGAMKVIMEGLGLRVAVRRDYNDTARVIIGEWTDL